MNLTDCDDVINKYTGVISSLGNVRTCQSPPPQIFVPQLTSVSTLQGHHRPDFHRFRFKFLALERHPHGSTCCRLFRVCFLSLRVMFSRLKQVSWFFLLPSHVPLCGLSTIACLPIPQVSGCFQFGAAMSCILCKFLYGWIFLFTWVKRGE